MASNIDFFFFKSAEQDHHVSLKTLFQWSNWFQMHFDEAMPWTGCGYFKSPDGGRAVFLINASHVCVIRVLAPTPALSHAASLPAQPPAATGRG